ncbi:MAG: DUF4159 domain-containing protein [Longimicrobiales bacterium]
MTATATAKFGLAALLAAFSVVGGAAYARSITTPASPSPAVQENTAYNGRFIFVRLRYNMGYGGFGRGRRGYDPCNGREPWAHDYPCAEQNITKLLSHITSAAPGVVGGNIIDIGDPELHKYPIAYMSEPGYWDMNDQEVANMRSYVLKGGFLIFDDFPDDALANFETQMKRMLPELEPIQLTAEHRIFKAFFEFESLDDLYGGYQGRPVFLGYFLNNDPTQRMLAIVNFQNDLGEKWEYAERGFSVVGDASTEEAYKFGINYIVYGLTH